MLFVASILAIAQAGAAPLPDIEIGARVRARDVKVESEGRASATVHVEPSAGQRVEVERNIPKGRTHYKNLDLQVNVDARLADPRQGASATNSAATNERQPTGD